VISGALEAVVVHGLCARQLPAHTRTPCEHIMHAIPMIDFD
jgi:hypothetical protein